jgi:hypothetical protein
LRAELAQAEVAARARTDLRAQLDLLLGPRLVPMLDSAGSARIARSLDGIERRLERMSANPGNAVSTRAPRSERTTRPRPSSCS